MLSNGRVDPACLGARDSPRLNALRAVREKFIQLRGETRRGSFRPVPGEVRPLVICNYKDAFSYYSMCRETRLGGLSGVAGHRVGPGCSIGLIAVGTSSPADP